LLFNEAQIEVLRPIFGAFELAFAPKLFRASTNKRNVRLQLSLCCAQEVAMSKISLKVNGKLHTVDLEPETPLLYVLSDEIGLRGPKFGCGMAQCGSCTVILRGQVVRSCVMPVSAVGQDEITTLEGLGTPEKPHPIQQAFIDEGAAQCGFCLSGVILTAKAVLDKKPNASDQEIGEALGGVLCRCFTHLRMLRAIRKYAGARKA